MNTSSNPEDPDLHVLHVEHAWLGLVIAALPVTLAAFTIDHTTLVDIHMSAYAILLALAVLGGCGWMIGSAKRQVMHELAEIRGEVRRLVSPVAPEAEAALRRINLRLINRR